MAVTHFPAVEDDGAATSFPVSRAYAGVVFALSFGLLLSDYMSRQVLSAVFPALKAEWGLSDADLGSLSGVVALMVGMLTFPLSLVADRVGRVRSLVAMAILWSLATLACGLSEGYRQMLVARLLVGVGEAAYGSVGVAVVMGVFPRSMRATITGAFMAGGAAGTVLGVASGGAIATAFGWRWAFLGMAVIGLLLALLYPLLVREQRAPSASPQGLSRYDLGTGPGRGALLAALFGVPSVVGSYIGSGLQLFVAGALFAWMPSFLNRAYGLPLDRAAAGSAALVLVAAFGMVACGAMADRLSYRFGMSTLGFAIFCALSTFALLSLAFALPPGPAQLGTLALGMFFCAGVSGPAGAAVAEGTDPAIHGTAFATLTLANNLLGLAPGPFVTGLLADRAGLGMALETIPVACLGSAVAFWIAARRVAPAAP